MKKLILIILSIILPAISYCSDKTTTWSHFAWGTEIGGAIDMSSNDMSTINLDAHFGYKNSIINVAGIGAGINVMVNNSNRAFPIYGIFRSNFSSKPSLCFADLRAGTIINNIGDTTNQTRLFLAPGIGFNLATTRDFKSYLILSYLYNGMNSHSEGMNAVEIHGLNMACLRIGITF